MTTAESISGTVEARNDSGIRVNGAWLNRSKFKPVELPDVGATVRLGLDPKGFITSLEIVETLPANLPEAPAGNREQTISRLAVLKAAAEFGARRPDLKSGDVLTIAQRWLEWVES